MKITISLMDGAIKSNNWKKNKLKDLQNFTFTGKR